MLEAQDWTEEIENSVLNITCNKPVSKNYLMAMFLDNIQKLMVKFVFLSETWILVEDQTAKKEKNRK